MRRTRQSKLKPIDKKSKNKWYSDYNIYFKLILIFGACIYALGFVVVSIHFARYNVSPHSFFRLKYILAGSWLILPLVLLASIIFYVIANFLISIFSIIFPEVIPYINRIKKKRIYQRLTYYSFMGLMCLWFFGLKKMLENISSIIESQIPIEHESINFSDSFFMFVFTLTVLILLIACMSILFGGKNKKNWVDSDRLWLGGLYIVFSIVSFFVYLLYFSIYFYPKIPAMFGGGKYINICVVLKEDKQTLYISKLIGMKTISKLSPALKLVATTDKSYIFIDPKVVGRSIELPKERVSVVVLGSDSQPTKKVKPKIPKKD